MCIIEYVLIMSNSCLGLKYSHFVKLDLNGLERIRPFTCKSCFCIRINHLTNANPEGIKFVSFGRPTTVLNVIDRGANTCRTKETKTTEAFIERAATQFLM